MRQIKKGYEFMGRIPIVGIFFATVVSAALLYYVSSLGEVIILSIVSFFAGALVTDLLVQFKNGINTIPILGGNAAQPHEKVFAALYIAIVVSSVISSYGASYLYSKYIQPNLTTPLGYVIIAFVFSAIVAGYTAYKMGRR